MLDRDKAIPQIAQQLRKMPVGHAIDLRTYKRNRSVIIVKQDSSQFRLMQNGFHRQDFVVSEEKLRQVLKRILKQEFPRSNKIRLYKLGDYSRIDWDELRRKVL